jgi:undecaprenyl-diphosphatase
MNESIAAAILGVVQGVTEFLPVSSSGHLVLFQSHLPVMGDHVAFDLGLHLGTLLPVLAIYRKDIAGILNDAFRGEGSWLSRPGIRLMLMVVVGSIPTAAIGLAFEDVFEAMFSDTLSVGVAFAVTGTLLWFTRRARTGSTTETTMSIGQALAIGTIQGLAITPGISRSGSTIALALFLGLDREAAARYSFLLSIPAIVGAFILKAPDLETAGAAWQPLVIGFITAAVTGYFALHLLLRFVRSGNLDRFAWYLWPLAAVAIGLTLAG